MSSQALGRVLRYSMVRQLNAAHARPEPARAQVAGFLGAKGGTGTTTLAAHFALAWKRQTGGKVLLLDMDSGSTSMDFLIRPNARYSIQDVATNLHRLDSNFWQSVVTETPLGIDFLPSPCGNGFGESLPADRVRHVLRFARREYPSIVVDLARLNPLSIGLIEETTTLFVVTTAELPAVSEANRVLKKLLEVGIPQDQLRLVFNRVPKAALNLVAELEKALGYPAYACIGDFYGELTESYGDGQRLEEGLALHKQVSEMVAKARGVPAHTRTNVLRRLLSRH